MSLLRKGTLVVEKATLLLKFAARVAFFATSETRLLR
jgi:hypothetical protein